MNNQIHLAVATLTLAITGCLFSTAASACGTPDVSRSGLDAIAARVSEERAGKFADSLRAANVDAPSVIDGLRPVEPGRAIVGMWQFTFISHGNTGLGIPDGAPIDMGFQTWHSDGTEFTNSSRPPRSTSFCTGVWGYENGKYMLNHYALSWDPTGSQFVGPGNIREEVEVDRSGNNLHGRFAIDQYDLNGTVLVHLDGVVIGTRVTVH